MKKTILFIPVLLISAALVLSACDSDPAPVPSASSAPAPAQAVRADTPSGPVRGVAEDGVGVYKGIPYAKPPVGDLRFAPTQDVEPWTDVLDCTGFGAAAVQDIPPGDLPMSEDCLTLNVWTPAVGTGEALPVYVWIHGGGFAQGTGAEADYNGRNFAREGIVTVTVNYRLNAPGFFASQQTYDEYGTTGNWGILDQIKALEWIRDNIGAFGGDPQNITIGGESAGAYCVSALITSPLAEGLFRRAIMESGSILGVPGNSVYSRGNLARTIELCRMMAYPFGAADNAGGLAKLRAADANVFAQLSPLSSDFTATPAFMMLPVFDGTVNPADIYGALKNGSFNKVDLLWGYNADEGSVFVPGTTDQLTYEMLAARMYGYESGAAVLRRFPVDAGHTSGGRAREILAYGMFSAVMKPYADAMAASGQNVYAYRFNYATAQNTEIGLGAHHGSEIAYAFGNVPGAGSGAVSRADAGSASAEQQALSDEMFARWAGFIKTGDPNTVQTSSGVHWPAYDAVNSQMLMLDTQITAAEMPGKEDIVFMEGIMFGPGGAYRN